MRKRIIAFIVCLVLVLGCGGTVLAKTIADMRKENAQEAELKAQNESARITELFHDQGHIYMTPDEPETDEEVTLRLRTVRYNVTRAEIQYTSDEGATWKTSEMKFEKQDETGYYDIWVGKIPAEGKLLYYRFVATNTELSNAVYYDKKGIDVFEGEYTNGWMIVPDSDVPDWAKGALWYNLSPDGFYNGNTTNDKQNSGQNLYTTWNKVRKSLSDRYGGDLDGIESKLDYIDSLYVDAIYTNPLWKSYQNMGYGPVHYDEVESALGNEEDLVELVDAVHERDMKIITDVVLTYTDQDAYYFDENNYWPIVGAYESEESEWSDVYEIFNWPDHYLTTWGGAALNLNTDTNRNLLWAQDDSYLVKYANLFDGYRFDCGGWLWGSSDTERVKTYQFAKEIKEATRAVNDEFLLMSESDWSNLKTNTWDSHWNYVDFSPKLQDYAKGLINESLMWEAMYEAEMTTPRNVALCLYNPMCCHDIYRVVQDDHYMYNAAALIQMTYLGSPAIYYGEEMNFIREPEDGVGDIKSFYAMDWDESNWDYERLNFYKALGELRQEYSCLKTGVFHILGYDNTANTMTFGRWDQDGAAITVTSQNEEMVTVEIPVHKCDIPDGTIMTDWLTGAQYIVEDGKITADVIPGGTVIVTGEKSSAYRQMYEQIEVGNASNDNSVVAKSTLSFVVSGEGTIDKAKDKFTYTNGVAYDDFSVFANLKGKGSATLMIRNGMERDDVYYAAVVDGEKLSIIARTNEGKAAKTLTQIECTKNTYVKLERTRDNTFVAYMTEVSDGNLGEWQLIKDSEMSISMDNKIYYGFAPLKGEMNVNNITFAKGGEASTFDKFDGTVSTALFDNINAEFVSLKDGKLTITNTKKQKMHYLLTNSGENDWTFKAKMEYTPAEGQYAGVVCRQDENNYIIAGRTLIDGEMKLFIGKGSNGNIAVYDAITDPVPDKEIIIQIQRIGGYYSAVYSSDDGATWNYLGRIFTNFSNERVGILVAGEKATASFDWVSFGDSINDGVSVNTPHTPIDVDLTYNPDTGIDKEAKWEWLTGDWSLVTGGWNQADTDVFAQASATNQKYEGLYAEATIDIKEGDGWAGIAFGKSKADSDADNGYVLQYSKDGILELRKNGVKIAKADLDVDKGEAVRVVVEAEDGTIIVYAGQNPTPVIMLQNSGYKGGYVSFCTNQVEADFCNFHVGHTGANWASISSYDGGAGNMLTVYSQKENERVIHGVSTLVGYAFTDFVCTTEMSIRKLSADESAKAGLLLCASEGRSASEDGIFVYLDGDGHLKLDVDGREQDSYDLTEGTISVTILVVKQNGTLKVFLKDQSEPVLEYTEKYNRGGVFTVYANNSRAGFLHLDIQNLQTGEDYTKTEIAQTWNTHEYEVLKDDFSSPLSEENYAVYNGDFATYEVKGGILRCKDVSAWNTGITISKNTYSDFTMEFKLRIDELTTGWMSIGMRKNQPSGDHDSSGVSVMISPRGGIFFYNSKDKKDAAEASVDNFEVGEWYDIKIVAKGSKITIYVDGVQMSTYEEAYFFDGYLAITSGNTPFSIDDLKITPMK